MQDYEAVNWYVKNTKDTESLDETPFIGGVLSGLLLCSDLPV